ncbi:HAMP domain-containing histidine kinase [Nitrospira defluvii]|nr:HAMP domain-containing histidine kinase [Nitrospira defluvii]
MKKNKSLKRGLRFGTLYHKLALVLFVFALFSGAIFLYVVRVSATLYYQEVTQKLNLSLAANISKEALLLEDEQINHSALENIFHMLMVINPSIEIYLLDNQGKILAYSAAKEKIKREFVDLKPVKSFIAQADKPENLPLKADDPRNINRQKIFSAAPISAKGLNEGYLYVILGGEAFDTVVDMLKGSEIMRSSAMGLATFGLFTRRLRELALVIQNYTQSHFKRSDKTRYLTQESPRDEIDTLGLNFNIMADHIDEQWAELKRSDEARREMVANVSHDLRTPLASLNGYLETLLMKQKDLSEAERTEYLETAMRHSQRLGVLIEELFELAKLDSYQKLLETSSFSMGELIQDVMQKFKLAASNKGIKMSADFGQTLPFVVGDIAMIQRVLENLLENALRHTAKGGTIALSLMQGSDPPGQNRVFVKVQDNGTGISEIDLPHIFERFYRHQKSRQDGGYHAGLGLAIVKRILELHGGAVIAQNEKKQGAIFTFDLPTMKV